MKKSSNTELHKRIVPLDVLARNIATRIRFVPYGVPLLSATVNHEVHGSRIYSRLTITRQDGKSLTMTKTQIGEFLVYQGNDGNRHGTYIETLDKNGATFWEDYSELDCWTLEAFSI